MDDPLTSRPDAAERVRRLRGRLLDERETESVPLDAVSGRVLAERVVAAENLPRRDVATMDGYALDADEGYPLRVVDARVHPGEEPPALAPETAVPIETGGALPPGATAVLRREDAHVDGSTLRGRPLATGTNTYSRASSVRAGETLFERGERLEPGDAPVLRATGFESVSTLTRFSVGVLATGSELASGAEPDFDSPTILGLVRGWGHDAVYEGAVVDDDEAVTERLAALATRHDVVVTSGGTGKGDRDVVVRSLRTLGTVVVHGVEMRPGRPVAAASLPEHNAVVVALPGKPLAAYLAATLVARPLFTGADALPTVEATLTRAVDVRETGDTYVIPVGVEDGRATWLGHADSSLRVDERRFRPGIVAASPRAASADGFVLTTASIPGGERVDVVPSEVLS